jgi:predicted HTH transcriptional regulator
MNTIELLDMISSGETSRVQFKRTLGNHDKFAAEMIAMANTKGGDILIGVEDKTGEIIGLEYKELQLIGSTIANIATDFVKPQIFPFTDVVNVETEEGLKKVLVVHIDEGIAKPYKERNGTIWVKQGADKRRLTDNNEQIRLFQQSGLIYVDEMIIPGTSVDDIDKVKVVEYLHKIDNPEIDLPDEQLYHNLNIVKAGQLTLAGLIFFSNNPQQFRPAFCIKAVSYFGNDISGSDYRGSKDIIGTLPEMFEEGMGFFNTYLQHKQMKQNFNSTGVLEISPIALEELLQNALTHRDYSKNAPVRIFIFDNRVEIISPGALPNNLTVENIKFGNTVVRNNLVVSFASRLMKYRGLGSGVRRALKAHPNTELINDTERELFIAVLYRDDEDVLTEKN